MLARPDPTLDPLPLFAIPLDENGFVDWLIDARPGDTLAYYRGHLSHDRMPSTRVFDDARRQKLAEVAKPSSFAASAHSHPTSEVTGLDTALALKAPLASPDFTGTPTAPTASAGSNSTQIATTAFVAAAVAALIDGSPGALDTLNELAAALGDDANFAATVTNALALKTEKAANLSDLASAAAARTNLGLGTLATQAAANVAITGGSIDGVTLDGGTF